MHIPEYPKAEDYIPEHIKDPDGVLPQDEVMINIADWLVFGDIFAEQPEDATPEDRHRDLMWWAKGIQPNWYVNFYVCVQEYGGPEEGGWWFTREIPIEEIPQMKFGRGPEGWLAAWNFKNEHGRTLVANMAKVDDEDQITIAVERHPARLTPKYRPHYC